MRRIGKRKGIQLLTIGLVVGLAAIGIWIAVPKQRLLLEQAHAIAAIHTNEPWEDQWVWISDTELLMLMTDPGADETTGWRGRVERWNIATGAKTHQPGLTALMNRKDLSPGGTPFWFELSPDHSWLLWNNATPNPYQYAAARLDGSGYRTWRLSGTTQFDIFFLDGSHRAERDMEHLDRITIRDLQDARRDREVATTSPEGREALARQENRDKIYLDLNQPTQAVEGKFVINTYLVRDTIQAMRYDAGDTTTPPLPIQQSRVTLPPGAIVEDTLASPAGRAICLHMHMATEPPMLTWLKQRLSFLHFTHPPTTDSLWVCRADGSDLHEIGHLPHASGKEEGEGSQLIKSIAWLPGGKQISFVYRSQLYIVPVEADR